MNRQLRCLLALTAFTAVPACGPSGLKDEQTESQVRALKETWKSIAEQDRKFKDFRTLQVEDLEELLKTAPTNLVTCEFRRICSLNVPALTSLDNYDLEKNFDNVLLEALIDLSAENKDGTNLLTLLKQNCPSEIGIVPLEFRLARRWPDSILLMMKSYGEAKSRRVRTAIVRCLGRAFGTLRDRFPKDEEFVAEARAWYQEHRLELELNKRYFYLASLPPPAPGTSNPRDLFLLRK
jgi:hypothetical protein